MTNGDAQDRPDQIMIFGYGSLVNRLARGADTSVRPYGLQGWRRRWGHCVEVAHGKVCALTIERDATGEVTGALVQDRRSNLKHLDEREHKYFRIPISVDEPALAGASAAFTYISKPPELRPGTQEFPIWRSYLECVLAGFLDFGGMTVAREFVTSTSGWEAPILDDRAAPKYERARLLPTDVQAAVDQLIHDFGLDRTQFTDLGAL